MKLRNKKTGEIVPASNIAVGIGNDGKWYGSLAELNEEWEDYEEPKCGWIISRFEVEKLSSDLTVLTERAKEIGNHFDTREEAEKAVEKLKAWKRLKDKGLEVTEWSHGLYLDKTIVGRFRYEFPIDNKDDIEKDLDLLFGGEE